ncbi:MAG: rhodanese-like domain-containing protein [Clostridiales bacterium]|jgi:phage shock protein E|nr:rhodanese-like domain-containing protein [Clostridiales bacterium]
MFAALAAAAAVLIAGCAGTGTVAEVQLVTDDTTSETFVPKKGDAVYVSISAQRAKQLMDSESDYVVLDVRTPEEYADGHIKGSMLIPYNEIGERAEDELPEKDKLILVYCRSGRRSKIAAQALAELGYTNVKEFGGIIDWPYEIVTQ